MLALIEPKDHHLNPLFGINEGDLIRLNFVNFVLTPKFDCDDIEDLISSALLMALMGVCVLSVKCIIDVTGVCC